MKKTHYLLIAAASLPLAAFGQFTFTGTNLTYSENFNDYRGSAATLPDNLFVEWDEPRTSEPFQGVNTGAFTAYTSDDSDYSFGIREREPVDLRDARLYFEFTNNTGADITGFEISYDVEAWFIGDRRNRIRLKYDDQLGSGRFEEDIFSTDNPSTTMTADTSVDGSLPENRTTVTGFLNLSEYLDPNGIPFGPLANGETAYLRWQISNTTGDGGDLRSGLAINNVSVTAIPEPETYAAIIGLLALAGVMIRRRLGRKS